MKLQLLKENFENFLNSLNEQSKIELISLEDFVNDSLKSEKSKSDVEMLGIDAKNLPPDELRKYLARIKDDEKEKVDKYKLPYVHKSNILIISSETGEEFDLDKLKADITQRPATILKQNEKITHSGGGATDYYNIGLPALVGLAVNEKTGEFVVANTCPGAGACKVYCYAKKGGYIQWKASSMSQTRLLNFLLNDPSGFKAKLVGELKAIESSYVGKDVQIVVRWHDAGDFFSKEYLDLAYGVANQLPTIQFYAYTKIADVASGSKPENFIINFSMGAHPSQEKQVDFEKTKHATVVKKELFTDLVAKGQRGKIEKDADGKYTYIPNGIETLKDRMASQYNISRDSIITYKEMMGTPIGDVEKYNVIVAPGDGDDSANRKDVLGTYLLIH